MRASPAYKELIFDCCSLDEASNVYLYGEITRTGSSVESIPAKELYYFG